MSLHKKQRQHVQDFALAKHGFVSQRRTVVACTSKQRDEGTVARFHVSDHHCSLILQRVSYLEASLSGLVKRVG